jgi:hypothetical protein
LKVKDNGDGTYSVGEASDMPWGRELPHIFVGDANRLAFEAWYSDKVSMNHANIAAWRADEGGGYDDPFVQIAWQAWKAAPGSEKSKD